MSWRRITVSGVGLLVAVILVGAYLLVFWAPITFYPVPPRANVAAEAAHEKSVIAATVGKPIAEIVKELENDVPRKLWSIDRKLDNCVPRKQVRVFKTEVLQTPKVSCTVVGEVTRGKITLVGKGDELIARFPISATISAEDVGGLIDRETATGSANVEMRVKLYLDRAWRTRANVDLSYRWSEEPGVEIFGQRISFATQADRELGPVVASIEKSLERQISELNAKSEIEKVWQGIFAVVSLNRENPPVWMRLKPETAGVGPFRASGGQILCDVMIVADTELFVGEKPDLPQEAPLGVNSGVTRPLGFQATIPVIANYSELQPVILRALRRLAAEGIEYENLGRLDASFDAVELYPTEGERIAVGISATVKLRETYIDSMWEKTSGKIWLTGKLITKPGSELVEIEELEIFGDMDRTTGDLLVRLASSRQVTAEIERALVEDFSNDYNEIVAKVRSNASDLRLSGLSFAFDIESVEHGSIKVTSEGLYMPVRSSGTVSVIMN